eukprot:8915589-Ditylum_brightwellii.AAC.1
MEFHMILNQTSNNFQWNSNQPRRTAMQIHNGLEILRNKEKNSQTAQEIISHSINAITQP